MNPIADKFKGYVLPRHVAIIMDGNGRWAKQKGHERIFGHQHAAASVRAAIQACGDLNIPYLTLYAFSTENWNRPEKEVNMLMTLLAQTIRKEIKELHEKNICLKAIGEIDLLPKKVLKELNRAIDLTKDNTKATLTLALNYGSRGEIVRAVQNISKKVKAGELGEEEINTNTIQSNLYTYNYPDVDLMIRTSGEQRISNFLLWQAAYAELYFTDVLWPDFREEDLIKAIEDFVSRERRYGKTGDQLKQVKR